MQFCLGVIPLIATGSHPNSIAFFCIFLPRMYKFLSQYYLYDKINHHQIWNRDSDLSDDMYFVKIIKGFDSKRP